jgi:hypothetical protein
MVGCFHQTVKSKAGGKRLKTPAALPLCAIALNGFLHKSGLKALARRGLERWIDGAVDYWITAH